MTSNLKIVLAQLNTTVGDIEGNLKKHIASANKARDELKADVIVFPELSITGYPPEDLLFRKAFIDDAEKALQFFAKKIHDIYCLVSHPHFENDKLYNACSLIYNGEIIAYYAKQRLPNYAVFDERRYFETGDKSCVVPIKGIPVGLAICEDLWAPEPVKAAVEQGARLILSPNASPFETNKLARRLAVLEKRATENNVPIIYVNNVGGQDDLIFDGGSMVVTPDGHLAQFAGFFNETLFPVEISFSDNKANVDVQHFKKPKLEAMIYDALVLAVRDYVEKNGFKKVILGLSGGIDSALTLAIAVDALGKDQVEAILMPSRYTADISMEYAKELIDNLGVNYRTISIEPMFNTFLTSLEADFKNTKADTTEENIQARCRAVILMALSNKFGSLVLSTSNRSELAVGYGTLYGDMAGGYAVLKDVPKTLVYALTEYRNKQNAVIPQHIIERAPTAELAPNQTDQDNLPPYSILDTILSLYLNEQKGIDQIAAEGFDRALIEKVIRLIRLNEYKRKQGPIGPRINLFAFARGRRYPVTNGYEG